MVPCPCKILMVRHVRHVDAVTEGTEVKTQEARKCDTRGMLPNKKLRSHGCEASRKSRVSGITGMEWCGPLRGITGS